MNQKIDLTGFIREEIELVIDDMTFNIPTDPDLESYIFLLNYLQGKFTTDEFLKVQEKLIISLIVNNNKNVDITKVKEKLGPTAIENFMNQYVEILIDKGVLKKVSPPQKEEAKKNQSSS